MNVDQYYGGLLKAEDLPDGKMIPLSIDKVTLEQFDDGSQKPAVHFAGKAKALGLNLTNKNYLKELYGNESDRWLGKPLVIFKDRTQYQGRTVPCIRVSVAETRRLLDVTGGMAEEPQPPPMEAPSAPPEGSYNDDDEDVPF